MSRPAFLHVPPCSFFRTRQCRRGATRDTTWNGAHHCHWNVARLPRHSRMRARRPRRLIISGQTQRRCCLYRSDILRKHARAETPKEMLTRAVWFRWRFLVQPAAIFVPPDVFQSEQAHGVELPIIIIVHLRVTGTVLLMLRAESLGLSSVR